MTNSKPLTKCERCGGTLFSDYGDLSCVNCGWRPPAKAGRINRMVQGGAVERVTMPYMRRVHRSLKMVSGYCEEHKDEVIADYYSMKLKDFFLKWKIYAGIWNPLKNKWGVVGKKRGGARVKGAVCQRKDEMYIAKHPLSSAVP